MPAVVSNIILVCSTWREASATIPEFWNIVRVNRQTTAFDDKAIYGVAGWLSRAKPLPISLSLNLRAGEFRKFRLSTLIPWAKLTTFELNDCTFDPRNAIHFFAQSPNIVNVRFVGINGVPVGEGAHRGPKLTVPCLKSLIVEFRSQTHLTTKNRRQLTIHQLFQRLILPNLRELEIRASHSAVDHEPLPSLLQLHARSYLPPGRLHLGDILFDVEELQRLLSGLPTLTELRLEAKTMYHSFSDLLSHLQFFPPESGGSILPKLETIFIADNVCQDEWEEVDEVSLAVLETRWWKGSDRSDDFYPLQKATIAWNSLGISHLYRNEAGSARAKQLVNGGLGLVYPTLL